MATVDFKVKNITAADGTTATLAEIHGSIDATSIGQFQSIMDKLVERGIKNLILDCANVKYINSTGLGTLLKYVDTFENGGGHMAFVRVPSKVMLVMEMLGFNALFDIQEDENAAMAAFGGDSGGEAAAPAEPEPAAVQSPISPAAPAAPASVPQSSQPAPAPAAVASPAAPAPAPSPAAAPGGTPIPGVSFPMQVECTRCRVTLEIGQGGKYKCPRCATILQVEPNGRVRFFASKKMKPIQLVLPTNADIVKSIEPLVASVAGQIGFNGDSPSALAGAVSNTASNMLSSAYGQDQSRIFHMIIIPGKQQITVRLSDHGNPLQFEGGAVQSDSRFAEAVQLMDMVKHENGDRGGNVLTMTKRVN
jgi:anti-anti-sigma factor